MRRRYWTVMSRFLIVQVISLTWVGLSVYLSLPWMRQLSSQVGWPLAIIIITFIAYAPGYQNAVLSLSMLFDRQPPLKVNNPTEPVTLLIAAHNEASRIKETLTYVARQAYGGPIRVFVIDNASADETATVAAEAGAELGLAVTVINEPTPGKFRALNTGLTYVETELVFTLDADTVLHRLALRQAVARYRSAPIDTAAVAGHVLVRNSRDNWLARAQEWDYFLGIASVKRMQGFFQSTLVAQGAFSLYRAEAVREVGGWPDAIGEDIVVTWRLMEKGYRIYFEPTAVAFTDVPTELRHFARQRSRWARGMFEGVRAVRPHRQPTFLGRYLTSMLMLVPPSDFVYTLAWLPGLVLACFGHFYIVGPYTLLVLPLNFLTMSIMLNFQRRVFTDLGLQIRRNRWGLALFSFAYQMLMSPISVWGYLQELFSLKRVW